MLEKLLQADGFIYELKSRYYFLGRWICKECSDVNATDCVVMYHMCRNAGDVQETAMYFHKIRAYSDFALEIPYNPSKIKGDMETLLSDLSESELEKLAQQFHYLQEDLENYC